MIDARDIIAKLRDKGHPTVEELTWFAQGLASGAVSDAQAGAFAMATLLNGLGQEGRVALTMGMRDSGDVMTWDLPGPVMDKHSTGGVGDCVSLVLAPALAVCGIYVPMISGRGLGHTGGTLDKLEAIPGYKVQITEDRLHEVVADIGCAIVGATRQIAPADRRLYAIRDVTSTVESIDLITASILSKKLAAGPQGLVLDVKVGSGAFMKTTRNARLLARSLVDTANGAGCATAAMLTDMNEPLAPVLGNALEVAVSMEVLAGNRDAAPRLHDLTVALGARVLELHGEAPEAAERRISEAISSGQAMARFAQMVSALGGPPDMDEDWHSHLPKAPIVFDVPAPEAGFVAGWQGQGLGLAVVHMGGGRRVETDRIDPSVGLTDVAPLGTRVEAGDPIARIHARDTATGQQAMAEVLAALTLAEAAPKLHPLVHERIDP